MRQFVKVKEISYDKRGSFLAACSVHQNETMATHAVERLSASAKEKTGIQVLLSTVYASAGKWSDFANVRKHMKEKGILKVPGSSSTDVNGVIHESTSGEKSHPEKILTDSILQEINCRLRDLGYVPVLINVLQDIDKQERILAEPTQGETSHCLRVCMFRLWNARTGC